MNFTNDIKDIMFKIDVSDVTLYMHMHFKSTVITEISRSLIVPSFTEINDSKAGFKHLVVYYIIISIDINIYTSK